VIGCVRGSQDVVDMRAHLWMVADNLLAPDSVEQNDALGRFGGHTVSEYEQNTQQSPAFGLSVSPQPVQT
jgi:hypothetical protein